MARYNLTTGQLIIDAINLNLAFLGAVVPTSPLPVVNGGFFVIATQAGTYTNFGGVEVSANSFAVISRDGAGGFSISQTPFDISSKVNVLDVVNTLTSTETTKPLSAAQGKILNEKQTKIETWTAKAYLINDQVNYLGKDWHSNAATLLTDVPGTSSKWVERLTAYVATPVLTKLKSDIGALILQGVFVNNIPAASVDFIKGAYVSGWTTGDIFLDYFARSADGLTVNYYVRNSGNTLLTSNVNVAVSGNIQKLFLSQSGASGISGYIIVDWSKYTISLSSGVTNNYKFTELAKVESNSKTSLDLLHEILETKIILEGNNIKNNLGKLILQAGIFVNNLPVSENGFIKSVYLSGWTSENLYLEFLKKNTATTAACYIRNVSNTIIASNGGIIFNGSVQKIQLTQSGSSGISGYIIVDWTKYVNGIQSGITNKYTITDLAKNEINSKTSLDLLSDDLNSKINALSTKLLYKKTIDLEMNSTNFNQIGWTFDSVNKTATISAGNSTNYLRTVNRLISNKIQCKWTINFSSNSYVVMGGYVGGTYIESGVTIDVANNKVFISKISYVDNLSLARKVAIIPFTLVAGRNYYCTIFRNFKKNTFKITDSITGQTFSLEDDWSGVVYEQSSGNFRDLMYVKLVSGGAITVSKSLEVYHPYKPRVVFGGDSNTENIGSESVLGRNWADILLQDVFINNGLKVAEHGINTAIFTAQLLSEIVKIKPDYLICLIGTNGATTQAQYQNIIDTCATNGIELILLHNPLDDGTRTYLNQNNINIRATGITTVRLDLATAIGNDIANGRNVSLYKDGVHFNDLGHKAIADRIRSEMPELIL